MATKTWAIFLVIFCTFLTASAQVLWKFGTKTLVLSDIATVIFNTPLIAGIIVYLLVVPLLLIAYKAGEINVLYPIIATGFIWVIILSNFFFNEPINLYKIIGIAGIFLGISFISYGGKNGN